MEIYTLTEKEIRYVTRLKAALQVIPISAIICIATGIIYKTPEENYEEMEKLFSEFHSIVVKTPVSYKNDILLGIIKMVKVLLNLR